MARYGFTNRGTCIDGPKRGEIVEKYDDVFHAYLRHPPPTYNAANFQTGLLASPPEARVESVYYRWSESLGQWCMIY